MLVVQDISLSFKANSASYFTAYFLLSFRFSDRKLIALQVHFPQQENTDQASDIYQRKRFVIPWSS